MSEIRVPDLGENIDEATVLHVLVAEGQHIEANQAILELESDKASFELPSPEAGVVRKILVHDGDTVKVGQAAIELDDGAEAKPATQEPAEAKPPTEAKPGRQETGERSQQRASDAKPRPAQKAAEAKPRTSTPAEAKPPKRQPGDDEAEAAEATPMPKNAGEATPSPEKEATEAKPPMKEVNAKPTAKPSEAKPSTREPAEAEPQPAPKEAAEARPQPSGEPAPSQPPGELVGRKASETPAAREAKRSTAESRAEREVAAERRGEADADRGREVAAERAEPEVAAEEREVGAEREGEVSPQGEAEVVPERGEREVAGPEDRDVAEHEEREAAPTPPRMRDEQVAVGPATRRFARELGVDLAEVARHAAARHITREHIIAYVREHAGATRGDERVRMEHVRRLGADRLAAAWREVPHVTHHELADITDLESARRALRVEEPNLKLTITALAIKASTIALRAHPRLNSSLDLERGELVLHHVHHIGIAVDTDRGLLVPVLRDAAHKSTREIAGEVADLADRARDRKLGATELAGATFSITNLGGISGTAFTPIVVPPQVAILGLARARSAQLLQAGAPSERVWLPLSLSYDHRAVDGAEAARFVAELVRLFQSPMRLLLDC